jgi:hypothetical protein
MALLIPPTAEEQKVAQFEYGKSMEELTIQQRVDLRKRIKNNKVDKISFEQYLDDYKKMAADPTYIPKFVKPNLGTGQSTQQRRARAEAKKTIEAFDEKFQRNMSRRKREKLKTKLLEDPQARQIAMAKKAEKRRRRRTAKLEDKKSLSPREKFLNFQQSLITRQLNDKVKANPNLILDNTKLMDEISTTVSKDGDIIKIKPNLSEIKNRGIFEIEHQRDIYKKGAMKDFPYNRNLILGPHNRTGGFKNAAEKFIEKNPDSPKVENILKKADELKVTLQPDVPEGTFPTKGLGYKQVGDPVKKFTDVASKVTPDLVDNQIGIAGYDKDLNLAKRALGMKKLALPALVFLTGYNMIGGEVSAAEPEESNIKYNPDLGSFAEVKDIDGVVAPTKVDQSGLLNWMSENPGTTAIGTGAAALTAKPVRKGVSTAARGLLKAIGPLGTPLGLAGISTAVGGYDLEEPLDRIGLEAELAFAKPLVGQSQKIAKGFKNPMVRRGVQQVLNLGLPAKFALRAARIATPLGLASLAAEGAYYGGKAILNEYNRRKSLSDEERAAEDAENEFDLVGSA